MGKKPRPISFWQWIAQLHWAIKVITPFLAFMIVLGGAAAAWETFGWWKPASVRYVNDKVDPLSARSLDLQIELAEGKREATQENIFKWRDKMDDEKDPDKKSVYRERVRDLENILNKQDAQIKTLNRIKHRQER